MIPLKIKNFFYKHKCKVLLFLLLIALIKGFWAWKTLYLEKVEEKIAMPVNVIETTDLFSESRNYVIIEWKDWKRNITYSIWEDWEKNIFSMETIEEVSEQKELRWTLKFEEYKIKIENNISDYLKKINNKSYEVQEFYTDFSKTNNSTNTKLNFSSLIKLDWNFLIQETIPLYDYYTEKAITKTIVSWKFKDEILWKTLNEFNIYSYWNWKEFKIINPEYISLRTSEDLKVSNFIEWTLSNKTHFLELQINKMVMNLPNKMYFSILAKSSENVLFNKIKIEIKEKETWTIIYKNKINYKEISEKSNWTKWIVEWKIWYKTNFWIPIEFQKDEFWTIIDKMFKNWNLDISRFQILLRPENDLDINLNYPEYIFNL